MQRPASQHTVRRSASTPFFPNPHQFHLVPDVHSGDSLPISFLQDVEPPLPTREKMGVLEKGTATAKVGATLGPWLIKHREAVAKPIIDGFIREIRKTPGVDRVGTIGFCWGGRYSILAAHETDPGIAVDAAYACHPSLVAIPGDFEPVRRPLSLALGAEDSLLGEKEIAQIKEIMQKKADVQSEVRVYEDQVHGFALRGDWSSEKDKKAMDDAEKQGIEWFKKFLV
jgi:dienelactone hydrolase